MFACNFPVAWRSQLATGHHQGQPLVSMQIYANGGWRARDRLPIGQKKKQQMMDDDDRPLKEIKIQGIKFHFVGLSDGEKMGRPLSMRLFDIIFFQKFTASRTGQSEHSSSYSLEFIPSHLHIGALKK